MKKLIAVAMLVSGMFALNLMAQTNQTVEAVITNGLAAPYGVTVDTNNNYYLTDSGYNRILKFIPDKSQLTVVAGGGMSGTNNAMGLLARFDTPKGIVITRGGLVVADSGNHLLRYVSLDGTTVSNLAGVYVPTMEGGEGGYLDSPNALAARFNDPAGLAADEAGNIYIADVINNAVRKLDVNNAVTTMAKNFFATNLDASLRFYRPAAVAVGHKGDVYVADTLNHSIKVIHDDGTVELVAGSNSKSLPGAQDSLFGTSARFNTPSGLLWIDNLDTLLVSDTGNHMLRYVTNNAVYGTFSVGTFANTDKASLYRPMGLAMDQYENYLIIDEGYFDGIDSSTAALRRIPSTLYIQPPVRNPVIGVVKTQSMTNDLGDIWYYYYLSPVINGIFNNDVTVAINSERFTETFFTLNGKEPSKVEGTYAENYENGMPIPGTSIIDARPMDVNGVTVKAIGTAPGRRSSEVVTARFQFIVAKPVLSDTLNMLNFDVKCATEHARLFYTTNGVEPTPSDTEYTGGTPPIFNGTTGDVLFWIKAFKNGYQSSSTSNTFYFTNITASTIGFTENGSGYKAGAGSTLLVPVRVNLAPKDQLRSLQYRVELKPNGSAPLNPDQFRGLDINAENDFIAIMGAGADQKPAQFVYYPYDVPGTAGTPIGRGLAITFIGTNANFNVVSNQIVNLLAVPIPAGAQNGQTYTLSVLKASGTRDGGQQDVFMRMLAPIAITVDNKLEYYVGDSSPARWYNAGDYDAAQNDFGDHYLRNNDVNNAFYASLGVRVPFSFSDVFDAMDAYPVDTAGAVGGDGQIRYLDWQIILFRSLGLNENNWLRYWGPNGVRIAEPTTLKVDVLGDLPATREERWAPSTVTTARAGETPASSLGNQDSTWNPKAVIRAAAVANAVPGQEVTVPVSVTVASGYSLAGLQFRVSVLPESGAPTLAKPVHYVADANLPAPGILLQGNEGPLPINEAAGAWSLQNPFPQSLQGTKPLGYIRFTIPATAQSGQKYAVHFANVDGAPNVATQLDFDAQQALVCVGAATTLPPEQAVTDGWKMHYFGSLKNPWADANADPDGDGVPNWREWQNGTNPTKFHSIMVQKNTIDWQAANPEDAAWQAANLKGLKLRWFAGLRKQYRVEASASLTADQWTSVAPIVTGQADMQEVTLPAPSAAEPFKFYRVVQIQ